MSARYEISEGELDVLAITGPEGTRYIDGEEIEARVIRQQSADIAELRAELAAAVAERDRLRDSDVFSRRELARGNEIIDGLRIERDQLRARLAAIDAAPTYALTFCHPYSHEEPGQLIARPAKD